MTTISIDSNNIVCGQVQRDLVTVTIDGLTAVTLNKVPDKVFNRLISDSREAIRNDGYTIRPPGFDTKFWFRRFRDGKVCFSVKPSSTQSAWNFNDTIEATLGSWALDAKIARLDNTITLPLPMKEVFMGLDFGNKRSVQRYKRNARGDSFYVGRKGRRYELIIYDKRKQSRSKRYRSAEPITHPCTRIEINSLPKKEMLVRELSLLMAHRPFKHVKWYNIELKRPDSKSQKKLSRYFEFEALVNELGFFMAKRELRIRTNRNFETLYGEFFELNPVNLSLDDIYETGMRRFFSQ